MRVLVTGANGMLGQDLCALLETAGHDVLRTDVSAREGQQVPSWTPLDITNLKVVTETLLDYQPDAVIHGAAYTDVDGCERNPDLAYRINALGTWNLAAVCGAHHITLTYVSTDFVFDGTKAAPYTEFDTPNPLSHYGASKLQGERFVAQLCPRHFIVRTAWLFGIHGKSFPASMLRAAGAGAELKVIVDQVGCPTHTIDLADKLIALLNCPLYGTYHVTNSGQCSWFDLARTTLDLGGFSEVVIHPIPASAWPSPTRRPAYSVLRHYALELQGHDDLRPWQEAVAEFIRLRQTSQS